MPAFEAVEGMPYWQDLATTDTAKSAYFYATLLGWKVEDLFARKDGLPVAGFVPQDDDVWVTYFLLRGAGDIEKLGGKVLAETDVALGRMTLCADPAGAMFGLIDPAGEERFVAAGEPGTPVWREYVAGYKGRECIDFYAELFDWEVREEDGYYLALHDGAPFLGMRVEEDMEMTGFWETYFGVADVQDAARRAPELGGEVLLGPELSPFGPLAVVADANGATVTLCEIDAPVEEGDEAESLFDL
ncbi:27 kDa antigen Cfp30B [Corynebacterium capitovis DSM 44611]|uniref:VOC family protein n=1 Tax=Corynebacterium capitovis TaxID=131081 RepID=UPI0003826EF2|nr:VOC family protein [Corynebacterium capitovis]WKD56651.1 27 kDa antigen Cfp30B [Corynebacterium capitovis DSM 44611]